MEETLLVDHRLSRVAYETDRNSHQVLARVYQRLLDQSPIPLPTTSNLQPRQTTSNVAAQLQEAMS